MVALGMNPAGTGPSVQEYNREAWHRFFEPPTPGLWVPLDPVAASQGGEFLRFRTSVGLAGAIRSRPS